MTELSNHIEPHPASANAESSSTIDFHSVIDLKAYDGKPVKIEVDSSVNEHPGQGRNASTIVGANERVQVTENGRPLPEHVVNNLTLNDHGRHLHLADSTVVIASEKGIHMADSEKHKMEERKVPGAEEAHQIKAAGHLPNLTIENNAKH
jgi:hypothetical protein